MTTEQTQFEKDFIEAEQAKMGRAEKHAAMTALLVDLHLVKSRSGDIIDLQGLQAAIAWHLVRCGYRPIPELRMIKPRRVTALGVSVDAIEWVGVDEPDDPLADLKNMTMGEINALPPVLKAQALRRMGGNETPDLPSNPGWKVKTSIRVEDAPDPDDDEAWNEGT